MSACLILITISNIQDEIQDTLRGSTAAVAVEYNKCYKHNSAARSLLDMTNTGIISLVMSGNYDVGE